MYRQDVLEGLIWIRYVTTMLKALQVETCLAERGDCCWLVTPRTANMKNVGSHGHSNRCSLIFGTSFYILKIYRRTCDESKAKGQPSSILHVTILSRFLKLKMLLISWPKLRTQNDCLLDCWQRVPKSLPTATYLIMTDTCTV